MITPSLEELSREELPREENLKVSRNPSAQEPTGPLPRFSRFIPVAAFVNAPLMAWFLLAGKLWSVGSVLAGVTISLVACGLLHIFVEKVMPVLIAGMTGQTGRRADPGAVAQFFALVIVKFLVLGLVGYVIINFREVNLPVVLIGFVLTQTAIVVTVARHLKTQPFNKLRN